MEDWTSAYILWQFKFECNRGKFLFNFEGTNFLVIQFRAWSVGFKVSGE